MRLSHGDVKYGERFRELRAARYGRGKKERVIDLARRISGPDAHSQVVYEIERRWRVPTLTTIGEHAEALECQPWELLQKVDTEYDLARDLAQLGSHEARRRWAELLREYDKSKRSKKKPPDRDEKRRHGARAS
jgi:hypothetical protein